MAARTPAARQEPTGPPTPADLLSAVQAGTHREALLALRDTLARSIETANGDVARSVDDRVRGEQVAAIALGQIAALSKQLRDTLAAIDAIKPPDAKSTVDELQKRRAARRSGSDVPARPARKVVGGTGGGGAGGKRRPDPGATSGARAQRSPRRKA